MREIKFRAWDKINNNMVGVAKVACEPISQITIIKVGVPWDSDKLGDLDETYNDQIILMQFTGLKDTNGKEIYEGDIVTFIMENMRMWGGDTKGIIVWDHDSFKIKTKKSGLIKYSGYLCAYPGTFEIIGNIYENQEMIK